MITDLDPWRESCATELAGAMYVRHGARWRSVGERGEQSCRQDMLEHLDHLQAALHSQQPGVFVHYVLWLKDMRRHRGEPADDLTDALDLLSSFFGAHLSEEGASHVDAIITTARHAVASQTLSTRFDSVRVPELPQTEAFRVLLLRGQHRPAMAMMHEAMQSGHSLVQTSVQLVQPALYQIGHLWQTNQITVSQEHLATAVSQNVLAGAYLQASFAPAIGKRAVFACVEGNQHGVGLQVLADAFETVGWELSNLGTNLPLTDLLRHVNSQHPDLLCLSLSMPPHLSAARATTGRLRAELGSRCPPIWVGGLVTLNTPDVWRVSRADAWAADALHALEEL